MVYLNRTEEYHRTSLSTLGWELTVCNTLSDAHSPCRRVLTQPLSFGQALFQFLSTMIPMEKIFRVLEVGGGYGNLMADFIRLKPDVKPAMLDISPAMLARQKEALCGIDAEFVHADFFDFPNEKLRDFNFAIFNENLGDFPTACDVRVDALLLGNCTGLMADIANDFAKYEFSLPNRDIFNYNYGAVRAVEKLCGAGIPYLYVSEHSCEARAPEHVAGIIIATDGNPSPISLHGHVEYTVKFSYLEKVAACLGYEVRRGCFADFLPLAWNDELRFIMTSGSTKDEHEAIRQFVEDLYTYEYLVMRRK
jgi:SAM-dependent methyltransferase